MKRFFLFILLPFTVKAQFAPAAGQPGTTAIKKDSLSIINWAVSCTIIRGLQDISNTGSGYADYGDSSKAVGPADGVDVVSLGDGGSATLAFQSPLKNGPGPDFCVFENAFDPGFLELGFVEVSSDGINYSRFAATSNQQNTVQIGPFDTSADPTKLNNLAGKYISGYGVPFDLQELSGAPGLDINNVTHVKIIDVVGCIQTQYATYDKNNNIINDLWPTAFSSGGFDLDAVGVIHEQPMAMMEEKRMDAAVSVFPAYATEKVHVVNRSGKELDVEISDVGGKAITRQKAKQGWNSITVRELPAGIYFLKISDHNVFVSKKIIKGE